MKCCVFFALCLAPALPGCGASDSNRTATPSDDGGQGDAATGAGGRGTGGARATSGGAPASTGGARPSSGGAGSGGLPATGGRGEADAAPDAEGPLDGGDGSASDSGDGSATSDADSGDGSAPDGDGSAGDSGDGSTTDGETACCASSSIWNASEGLLPSEVCPPWPLVNSASAAPVLGAAGVTFTTSAIGEVQAYRHGSPNVAAGSTVRLAFRMRLISSSSSAAWRTAAHVGFAFGPERRKNLLFVGVNEIFLLSAENTRAASASVTTTDAQHDYTIDVNTGTGAVSVMYDGTPTLTGSLFTNPPDTLTDYVVWGDASVVASGTSVWSRFEHDAWTGCAPR